MPHLGTERSSLERTRGEKVKVSPEQAFIVEHIAQGANVIVDAIAGSGKSTTILTVARAFPKLRFLQFTYNAMLRKEFKSKMEELNITNIEVHTYHSFAVKYYASDACTDTGLRKVVSELSSSTTSTADTMNAVEQERRTVPQYNILVLDECQDMTPLYYHFVRRVLETTQTQTQIQLLILGDYMQGIYEFKGADIRFLTMAASLWSSCPVLSSTRFVACGLTTSYRITHPMASFVNHVMLGEERLHACRDGEPVQYIRNTRSNMEKIVIYHIKKLLAEGDLPSDIFILGPSVKGVMSNIRKLENALVECNIPCHVPMIESDKMDEKVIDGKVVFSTFHTVKGRQRKYVFVVGFDQAYFSVYARKMNPDVCPNTLYVATTRATHKLFLMESSQYATDKPLPFLRMGHHDMKLANYIDFKGNAQTTFWERDPMQIQEDTSLVCQVTVSELIRFIPDAVLEDISERVHRMFVKREVLLPGFTEEEIPSVVCLANGMYEDVSDLNGIALPCMFHDAYLRSDAESKERSSTCSGPTLWSGAQESSLYRLLEMQVEDMNRNEHAYLRQVFRELPTEGVLTVSDYLYMSNIYTAFQERLYFKLKQIQSTEYSWISDKVAERCTKLMTHVVGETTQTFCEEQTILSFQMETEHVAIDAVLSPYFVGKKYRFKARVDLVTDDDIWEFKCTRQLSMEHFLQVVLYAWMWKVIHQEEEEAKTFRLFNVKTAEHYELVASVDELTYVVVALLQGKYGETVALTDDEFVRQYSA